MCDKAETLGAQQTCESDETQTAMSARQALSDESLNGIAEGDTPIRVGL